tara:strand:- start:1304 stop:1645 length:342 start_codon:yes stop_codon:yes gene_type:complete
VSPNEVTKNALLFSKSVLSLAGEEEAIKVLDKAEGPILEIASSIHEDSFDQNLAVGGVLKTASATLSAVGFAPASQFIELAIPLIMRLVGEASIRRISAKEMIVNFKELPKDK